MRVVQRGYHFIQRIIRGLKKIPRNISNFGLKIALISYWDSLFPPEKKPKYISAIEAYVDNYLNELIKKYKKETYKPFDHMITEFEKIPVWCCWWQGIDHMPELVAMCNKRLQDVLPEKAQLHIITEKNYQEYIQLPSYIMEKVNSKKMSITALSDIIRVLLLSKYGGFWIDSTVFVSGEFPEEFITSNYYSQKMYDPKKWVHEACKGRWCGFMMAGSKDNIIFRFIRDAYLQWWKDHDDVIDYVILDYFLLAAYKNIDVIKEMIDNVPDNNIDVFEMYKVLHLPYSDELWGKLTEKTCMHKLTYKIDLVKETEKQEPTLYAYLLSKVGR